MTISSPHVDACVAEGEAAGWTGAALARLVIDPKSETMAGFRAKLAEADNIRALIKIVAPTMRAIGCDPDTAADYFVAQGYSLETVRKDTAYEMAFQDENTTVDTGPVRKVGGDVYANRAKEIDEYNGKKNG